MLKDPGKHIGDTWYYIEENICHCFYLTCPDTQPRHQCWDIAHATSRDLIHWTKHGIVIPKGQDGEWDCSCLSTGSVIRFDNRYWMAYSGKWDGEIVQIGLAVSDDLHTWKKCNWNPVCKPDGELYAKRGRGYVRFVIGVIRFFLTITEQYICLLARRIRMHRQMGAGRSGFAVQRTCGIGGFSRRLRSSQSRRNWNARRSCRSRIGIFCCFPAMRNCFVIGCSKNMGQPCGRHRII